MKNKAARYIIIAALIPAVVISSALLLYGNNYTPIYLIVAVLSCLPVFIKFERGDHGAHELILIAAMTALSVAGRVAFTPLQNIKPVAAIVIFTGMYFGAEAGFMTGSLSAVVSNIFFGQGPWTPFQMLGWGIIGFVAGLASSLLRKNRLLLCIYGAASGVIFSLVMDINTVVWQEYGYFSLTRYAAYVVSATPVTLIYAVSNVIFLFVLARPMDKILRRIIIKYGIGAI